MRLRSRLLAGGALAAFAACSGASDQQMIAGQVNAPPVAAPAAGAMSGAAGSAAQGGPAQPAASGGGPSAAPPSDAMGAAGNAAAPQPADNGPQTPAGGTPTPAQCKGFELLGLEHSPGGTVLPNTCAPFDGTLNNPYAIRCIDADPSYDTGYPGDEYCILPPPENLGTQIHVAPGSYDSPGEFELAAGAETSTFYAINAPNTEAHFYYRANWRMRPGGHHMLISMQDQDRADGWSSFGDMGSEFGSSSKSFGGAQRASVDRPQGTLDVPPENAGLGQQLAARQQFTFNLHHINTTNAPVLREVWLNVWYVAEQDLTAQVATFAGMGSPADMSIAAGRRVELEYACAVAADTRIISLYGHYHAHGQRFGAWIVRASGETLAVYESFDWEDIPVYQYDSISMNPVPDVSARSDGASTGILSLSAGDELHFQCEVDNDSDRALRFADEAITGEMCILFGAYTGTNPCASVRRVR